MSATNRTLPFNAYLPQIITASVCTVVCLVAVILLAIITIKSHCCDQRHSRKQRIFLYLLLASLGSLLTELLLFTGGNCHNSSMHIYHLHKSRFLSSVGQPFYLCFNVFVTLRRIEFRGPNLCSNTTEVCYLLSTAVLQCLY